ncbi:MAG TPA: hypothetical protein VGV15_22880 [Terriglobales bacterium]|nr:hypothetical protein [Terriglobales bacterium]
MRTQPFAKDAKRLGTRLADDSAYRRVGIVQLKRHFRSRVHRAFLEHLRQSQEQRNIPLRSRRVAV